MDSGRFPAQREISTVQHGRLTDRHVGEVSATPRIRVMLHVQLRDGPEVDISRRQARQFKMLSGI